MRALAVMLRGMGRITKLLLLLAVLAFLLVAIPGGLARAVQELATPREPDQLPTPSRPTYATADELLFAAAAAGAGCDAIEAFPTTTTPVTQVPVTAAGEGATTDEEAAVAVGPAAPAVPGLAGSSSGVTCTSGEARVWMLVYDDATSRDRALVTSVADVLCPLAGEQPLIRTAAAGNWLYAVAGDADVLTRATDALGVDLTPGQLSCPS